MFIITSDIYSITRMGKRELFGAMKPLSKPQPDSERSKSGSKTRLKEVAIPKVIPKTSHQRKKRVVLSESPESSLSGLDSTLDQFSDSETPETSAMMTPAESSTKRDSLPALSSEAAGGRNSLYMTATKPSSKRKRAEQDEDAFLAQLLQDEENSWERPLAKRPRKITVENSEDELILSDFSEVSHHPTSSLSIRSAREKARSSIRLEASREVLDTESDDAILSEYMTPSEIEDEDHEDQLPPSELPTGANAPVNPIARRADRRTRVSHRRRPMPTVNSRTIREGNSWRFERRSRVSYTPMQSPRDC